MTSLRFVQLSCEACPATYPPLPAPDMTAGALRVDAARVGWEVLRGTKGRDLCPPCRVKEINAAAGTLMPMPEVV